MVNDPTPTDRIDEWLETLGENVVAFDGKTGRVPGVIEAFEGLKSYACLGAMVAGEQGLQAVKASVRRFDSPKCPNVHPAMAHHLVQVLRGIIAAAEKVNADG
jgi:hypothetical protein